MGKGRAEVAGKETKDVVWKRAGKDESQMKLEIVGDSGESLLHPPKACFLLLRNNEEGGR